MTKIVEGAKGEGKIFESTNSAINAYDYGLVDFRAKIKVLPGEHDKYSDFNGDLFETTVGRLLFNSVLPKDFSYVNDTVDRRKMSTMVDDLIAIYGLDGLPDILDKVKVFGFKYATHAGITWSITDLAIPKEKDAIIEESKKAVSTLREEFNEGLLSEGERRRMSIEIWQKAKSQIEDLVTGVVDPHGSVNDMISSGARGSVGQLTQMIGMKGLIQNPNGDIIETPVIASYKEGMSPVEYFITTHGSRKGLADTALKTAQAGYLTRRLFNVAQDVVIIEEECGTDRGVVIPRVNALGMDVPMAKNAKGRILVEDIKDKEGNVVMPKGHLVLAVDMQKIEEAAPEQIVVRSPITCKTKRGICQHCYGHDITTNELVDLGEAVGTVAAQAIGEPGTQLTMNTKHAGGAASAGGDVTQGLPRVEEIFDRRIPKSAAVIARIDGVVAEIIDDGETRLIRLMAETTTDKKPKKRELEYKVPIARRIMVKQGQTIEKGQFMTDGSAELREFFTYAGQYPTQEYIIGEITKIYELQGVGIARKHLEVVVKQMFSRRKVKTIGDTHLSVGQVVEDVDVEIENERVEKEGGIPATAERMVTGITETSLTRNSWLSSSSFQNTTRKLTEAAVRGSIDHMRGLNENVIVGRIIPAGTGFKGCKKYDMIQKILPEETE